MSSTEPVGQNIDGHAITCRELVALVTDYLERALTVNDRLLFDAHVDSCEGCRRHLEQIRFTVAATGRLREQDMPVDVRDRLLLAFKSWKRDGREASTK